MQNLALGGFIYPQFGHLTPVRLRLPLSTFSRDQHSQEQNPEYSPRQQLEEHPGTPTTCRNRDNEPLELCEAGDPLKPLWDFPQPCRAALPPSLKKGSTNRDEVHISCSGKGIMSTGSKENGRTAQRTACYFLVYLWILLTVISAHSLRSYAAVLVDTKTQAILAQKARKGPRHDSIDADALIRKCRHLKPKGFSLDKGYDWKWERRRLPARVKLKYCPC